MPNTQISLGISDQNIAIDIAIPAPDLLLALTGNGGQDATSFLGKNAGLLQKYFNDHLFILQPSGERVAHIITKLTLIKAHDVNVGAYEELDLLIEVPIGNGLDLSTFSLRYDAVIHQIPTHFAIVRIAHHFRSGLVERDNAVEIGVIKYDFAANRVPDLDVNVGAGSVWSGLIAMLNLGVHHVLGGLDHILFLTTLLVVAPLRSINGSWSLFQGYGYAARRFFTISLAFTLGHSAALAFGVYDLVAVNGAWVEVLIAISILVAAGHAIRPLFAGQEWWVAAMFGLVHGLAFSQSLKALHLSSQDKAVAMLGFNIGIEAAQLSIMTAALPITFASKLEVFHMLRCAAMLIVCALAAVWIYERSFGLSL